MNKRVGKPSVNAPRRKFCKRGTLLEVEETPVSGDFYEGNNIWYKDKSENYYWSGAVAIVEEDPLTEELKSRVKENASQVPLIVNKDNKTEPVDPVQQEAEQPVDQPDTENSSRVFIDYTTLYGYITDYRINELWKITKGNGISVAILDSGLDYNNQQFKNKIDTSYFNAFTNSEMRQDCMDDKNAHGTNCAAILCGASPVFSGVSPEIKLNVIKVTDQSGKINTAALTRGLEKAIEIQADIIAMCFYVPIDNNLKTIQKLIKHAYDQNIIVVGAAGNQGAYKFPVNNYPASFAECISVGSVNGNKKRNLFSSKSDFLNLMAPGEYPLSNSDTTSKTDSTGYAAAFVTGTIALLLAVARSKGKKLSVNKLYTALRNSSSRNFQEYNSLEYGWGIINPIAHSNAVDSL